MLRASSVFIAGDIIREADSDMISAIRFWFNIVVRQPLPVTLDNFFAVAILEREEEDDSKNTIQISLKSGEDILLTQDLSVDFGEHKRMSAILHVRSLNISSAEPIVFEVAMYHILGMTSIPVLLQNEL